MVMSSGGWAGLALSRERLRSRLAESLNDEVAMAIVPAARHFQHGVDLYLEIRAKLLPEECDQKTLNELTGAFRFSDAVLRHLVVSMDAAVTEPSPMAKAEEEEANQGSRRDRPREELPADEEEGAQS